MKQIFLISLMCLLIIGCARQQVAVVDEPIAKPVKEKKQAKEQPTVFVPTPLEPVILYSDLADGTHNWVINADTYGSSVENFRNAARNLTFTFNRAEENPAEEKWTWSEIIMFNLSSDWRDFNSIDITYTSDETLVLILADSELYVYNPAAGFFTTLPPTNGKEVSLTLAPTNTAQFKQHAWVVHNFPQIRTVFDPTTIIGIKLGTTAIGGQANATISRFVLNGVILD